MSVQITGKMKVDYVSKKTGRQVIGTNIFVAEPIKSDYGEGHMVDKLFVSESDIPYTSIDINKKCDVVYDIYGRVREIRY